MSEGAISYPRTYGKRRRRRPWRRGRRLYLPIVSREIIIEYREWDFKLLTYTKRTTTERNTLRREFDGTIKIEFLKFISIHEYEALSAAGFNPIQIEQMAKGIQPRGYSVHHVLPLDDGGDNSYQNLILIRESPEHAGLTAYQNSTTQGLSEGESRDVDYPIPEGLIVVYPPTNDSPTLLPLWPPKGTA